MIYSLHYVLFNLGLPAVIILLTLFLQTYTDASLTEIGTLLMALPFISIVAKPLFCALADRQQAHRGYLMGSLALMVLGYGSLIVAPFFPQFIKEHSRLVWYLDVLGIVIGFSAFGVVWSLGDALAVNAARKRGVPWGTYRVWATIAWGVGGCLIGQINETPLLPKYVPAFIVLAVSCSVEILCLALYPARYFDMSDSPEGQHHLDHSKAGEQPGDDVEMNSKATNALHQQWSNEQRSLSGTLSGTARLNPRLMGAMANVFMEDLGSSIRSSLSGRPQGKRMALDEILEQHKLRQPSLGGPMQTPVLPRPLGSVAAESRPSLSGRASGMPLAATPPSPAGLSQRAATIGKSALRRTQLALSRMNSLSSATGHAIADEINAHEHYGEPPASPIQSSGHKQQAPGRPQVMLMSSLASGASLSRAAAARAIGLSPVAGAAKLDQQQQASSPNGCGSLQAAQSNGSTCGELVGPSPLNDSMLTMSSSGVTGAGTMMSKEESAKYEEDLQLVLLKVILKRDVSILKYLVLFTLFGILFTIHIAYFFIHVESLCREHGAEFSHVMGAMLIMHAVSEVFSFLVIVPCYMPRVGRFGSFLTSVLIFAARFGYYGSYYVQYSPYTALVTEAGHGITYGIIYSLITEIAGECVDHVDTYMPELIERGLVHPQMNPGQLKLPLRATMYGLFSGAFDGLGNGIGALFAGVYLDSNTFVSLWMVCGIASLVIAAFYMLSEWRLLLGRERTN